MTVRSDITASARSNLARAFETLIHSLPHGSDSHHVLRALTRIDAKVRHHEPWDAATAFRFMRDTVMELCDERIHHHFLDRKFPLFEDVLEHIEVEVRRMNPDDTEMLRRFGVRERRHLDEAISTMRLYVADEVDPRDMLATLAILTSD